MKTKRSFKDSLWPPVDTEQGRKDAITYGTVAAGWIALSYLFGLVYMFATGEVLAVGAVEDGAEFVGWVAVHAVIAAVAAVLCWRIWRAQSRVAAIITLGWVLVEVVVKLAMTPGQGLVISAIVALAAINGVRGARAHARLRATGETGA
ncbi:MAG: hypothetical protein ACREER_00395 [Alphaproteobacteria bacterium]